MCGGSVAGQIGHAQWLTGWCLNKESRRGEEDAL